MLRKAIAIALIIVLFIGGLPAQAQPISPAAGNFNNIEAPQSPDDIGAIIREETDTLKTQLNLTGGQQREGRRIIERRKAEQDRLVQAIQRNPNNRGLIAKLQAHQAESIKAFERILSPAQKNVFDASRRRTLSKLADLEPENEANGPLGAFGCVLLCELACLLLPPGPICDCLFCITITWLPGPKVAKLRFGLI